MGLPLRRVALVLAMLGVGCGTVSVTADGGGQLPPDPDSGVLFLDAGSDAGNRPDDAGADAGPSTGDAGLDAGVPDAGSPLDAGVACGSGADCASAFCVDGVCCESACTGLCESCTLPGREGFCDAVPANEDPADECATQPASTCGTTGVCNGVRACALYAMGAECVAASCAGTVSSLADTCDGLGVCVDRGSASCAPLACDSATGLCRITCTGAGDCTSGFSRAAGVCKKAQGATCGTGAECASGFCADGVCCDGACSGLCEKCNLSGRAGFCDAIAASQDPDNECATSSASTCGTNGVCSGARSCQLYPASTVCTAAACADAVTSAPADTCNGSGTCVDTGTVGCGNYTCNAASGTCRVSCVGAGDCVSGFTCAAGVCKKAQGATCGTGAECGSGFCTDSVCCAAACGGSCERCNLTGRAGFCDAIPAGQDPDNECATSSVATCGTSGACSGARSCQLYPASTVCTAAACANAVTSAPADTCNGSGSCVDTGTVGCGNYTCNSASGACRVSCVATGDCAPGKTCSVGACI